MDCRILLHDISLQYNSTDKWEWRLYPNGGYSVRDVLKIITIQEAPSSDVITYFIWHIHVPLKVSILVCRFL
jgi:hypothetical protein